MSAPASADRNLLIGLLALQIDFVTRGQLLEGLNAWMLEKQTALGEILHRCLRGSGSKSLFRRDFRHERRGVHLPL